MRPGSVPRLYRMIRGAVYSLKRRYGAQVDVYLEEMGAFDPATGRSDVTYTKTSIRRAIVLPGNIHRDIFQSITFLRANSNFAHGADIQNDDRSMIFDGKDLPRNFKLTDKHYYVFNRERWDLQNFSMLEDGLSYFVNVRRSRNAPTTLIHDAKLKELVALSNDGFDTAPMILETNLGDSLLTQEDLPLEAREPNA